MSPLSLTDSVTSSSESGSSASSRAAQRLGEVGDVGGVGELLVETRPHLIEPVPRLSVEQCAELVTGEVVASRGRDRAHGSNRSASSTYASIRARITSRLAVQNASSVTSRSERGPELLGGVHPGPREQRVVPAAEVRGIVLVSGEQPEAEQQAIRVRPVVEVGAVVVGFQQPHVGVGRRLIEPVAVGVCLRLGHHLAQFACAERSSLTSGEDLGLERVPRADVDDDLVRALEIDVEQREALGRMFGACRVGPARLRRPRSRRRSTPSRRAPSAGGAATTCARPASCCGTRDRVRAPWSGSTPPIPTNSAGRVSDRRRTACRTLLRSCRHVALRRSIVRRQPDRPARRASG